MIKFLIILMHKTKSSGFTLIELLIVMAIVGILSGSIFYGINPGRQLAKARDTQRESHIYGIVSAVLEYQSEHSGDLPDTDGNPATNNFPTSPTCIGTSALCYDLAAAGGTGEEIVPVYMAEMPVDPKEKATGQAGTQANTGYKIYVDANGRITASASGEVKTSISVKK
jgi:prepilin-type N-terminal cleavage/methylation domain-containing protein